MKREIIEKISEILKEEIEKVIKNIKDIKDQNAEIYDYLERYIPYIDHCNGNYDIEIKRKIGVINIVFKVDKENYMLSVMVC